MIAVEGGKAVARMLAANRALRALNIRITQVHVLRVGSNDIGKQGGRALAEAMRSHNTTLSSLDISIVQ